MDLLDGDVELTEFEAIDVRSVKGVGQGANGFPFLLMKGLPEPAVKDWAAWDAAHEGGKGGSNAGAASAQAEARQTQAQERAKGKGKPTAAELHNAHEVHVAHEEHEAHLHAEHESHVGHHEHETHEEHEAAMRAERGQTHPASSASTPKAPSAEQEAKDKQLSRKAVLAAVAKAVDADGTIDEGPDVDLGQQIMGLLAQAIINEAQEIKAGAYGESCDVDLLNCAASMVTRWIGRESADSDGGDADMGMLMASAAIKAAELAKKPGTGTSDDTTKSTVAEGGTTVDTEPQGNEGLSKALEAAVTKATAPLIGRVTDLESANKAQAEELAKVKATPIPGGPMMSVARPAKADGEDGAAAKVARFDYLAEVVADPNQADRYRQLAAQERAKLTTS